MPIYAYQCQACSHTFDVMQKMSDPAPSCPVCGHAEVRKQLSAAGFQLKGGGWYATDFKGGSRKDSGGGSDSDSGPKTGGGCGGGSCGGCAAH
jgi:putative FmdB family regulatory protein